MRRLEEQVEAFAGRYGMICPGDGIVLGLSGGADSVCLLFVLKELQKKIPFRLAAVHVNHNLRGDEACRDQEFSRLLCRDAGIPFFPVSVPVGELAAREKISLEEAGRRARYRAFARICRREGYEKVALAHHRDDLAETMLYHLARGTGIAGLCGIRPVSGNRIRPLLCVSRREIEAWLGEKGIVWQTDSSNLDDHFTRNKIRHHVADYLVKEINPEAVNHMADTAGELWELEELAEELTEECLKELAKKQKGGTFLEQGCLQKPAILRKRMLHTVIAREAGSARDITRAHVEAADSLWEKQVGKFVCLPRGVRAIREYNGIWIGSRREGEAGGRALEGPVSGKTEREEGTRDTEPAQAFLLPASEDPEGRMLPVPGTLRMGEYEICCEIRSNEFGRIEEKTYTKWLDYDKIDQCLRIRHRRPGDRFAPHPLGGKKLKDYLIDCKVPQKERDSLWLLAAGSEILWIIGGRISERYKVKEETQRVLYIQIKGGKIYERQDQGSAE